MSRLNKIINTILISLGYKKRSRYKVIYNGKLRIDRERGCVEPNWGNEEVLAQMNKQIRKLDNYIKDNQDSKGNIHVKD